MEKNSRIYLAGSKGMVGSALMRGLQRAGHDGIITSVREELDLRHSDSVDNFLSRENPDYVLVAAAKVGGIEANRRFPADFIYDNLMIQTNLIHQSHIHGVKKLLFLGSSCIYPRESPQPMKEEFLLSGPLEPTNEAYAVAKIAGIKMAQYYRRQHGFLSISPIPSNVYGPNDSFDLQNSHVLSALVKRFVDAVADGIDEVVLWGTGVARREFLHVDDLAEALLLLMEVWNSSEVINVGSGKDISIRELAMLIASKVGYQGEIGWNSNKPDGMLRKRMDVSKLHSLGFRPAISLDKGIEQLIDEYRAFAVKLRANKA